MKDAEQPLPDTELDELRSILRGADHDVLVALQQRVSDPGARAADVVSILPVALAQLAQEPLDAGAALRPVVETALEASVQRDAAGLGGVLAPALGSALRVAAGNAVWHAVRSIDRALSFRSLGWRLEARRLGRPFREVALRHACRFHVERVLLIHRASGVLLHQVESPDVVPADPDVAANVLSAIHDAALDATGPWTGVFVTALDMGDCTLWVASGPLARVAAVVRGEMQNEYREVLTETAQLVHTRYAAFLEQFSGELAPFVATEGLLSGCLSRGIADDEVRPMWRAYALMALVVAALGTAGVFWYQHRAQWQRALHALQQEPGIVVVSSQYGPWGGRLAGLRDRYASDPASILSRSGIDASTVEMSWRPFQSGEDTIAERRAADLLAPPPEVRLAVRDGVLRASGRASVEWTEALRQRGPFIAGIEVVDTSALADTARLSLNEERHALSPYTVGFAAGEASLGEEGQRGLRTYAERLADFAHRATLGGAAVNIVVVGWVDPSGNLSFNTSLARRRASVVGDALVSGGVPASLTRLDVSQSESDGGEEGAAAASRCATVVVLFVDTLPGSDPPAAE